VRTWLGIATVSRRRHRAKEVRFRFSIANVVASRIVSFFSPHLTHTLWKKIFFQFFYNFIFFEKDIFLRKFKTLFATFVSYLDFI